MQQIIEGAGTYLVIATALIVLYFWILNRFGLLKIKTASIASASVSTSTFHDIIPKQNLLASQGDSMALPPEVDTIAASDLDEDESFEFLDDDENENLLLKEAERVIDKIQDEIKHIASNPPNPEEVTSKIRAIVNPYQLFNETEYYGAINTYIALSVERDLGIKLSSEEIIALWN